MDKRQGGVSHKKNLKQSFKAMAAGKRDAQAYAANDTDLIERNKMNQNTERLKNAIKQNSRNFNDAVPKTEANKTKAEIYDLMAELKETRAELAKTKKELNDRHVFGRITNMKEEKISFTISLPKTYMALLEKESKKAGITKTQMSRIAIINLLIEKGHNIIFESDI